MGGFGAWHLSARADFVARQEIYVTTLRNDCQRACNIIKSANRFCTSLFMERKQAENPDIHGAQFMQKLTT
jgi:hypothetical protein